MRLIERSMKVSEAARLAAAMNARLVARPGRLEIEALTDLHVDAGPNQRKASQRPRRGAGGAFPWGGSDGYRAHLAQQGGCND